VYVTMAVVTAMVAPVVAPVVASVATSMPNATAAPAAARESKLRRQNTAQKDQTQHQEGNSLLQ